MVLSNRTLNREELLSAAGAVTNALALNASRYLGTFGKGLGMILEAGSVTMTQIGLHMELQNHQISKSVYAAQTGMDIVQGVGTILGLGYESSLERSGAHKAYLRELYKDAPSNLYTHIQAMKKDMTIFQKIFTGGRYSIQNKTFTMSPMQYFHFKELFEETPSESMYVDRQMETMRNYSIRYIQEFFKQRDPQLYESIRQESIPSFQEQIKSEVKANMYYIRSLSGEEKPREGFVEFNINEIEAEIDRRQKDPNELDRFTRQRLQTRLGFTNDPSSWRTVLKNYYGKNELHEQRLVQNMMIGENVMIQTTQLAVNYGFTDNVTSLQKNSPFL